MPRKKIKILAMSLIFAFIFSACSNNSSDSSSEKEIVNLYNQSSFNETNGYSVYVKDSLNYGVYEYDIASLTKQDFGVSIPVVNSDTSFLHSFVFKDYLYIVSSSVFYDSFVTRISISNPSDIIKISFKESEFITFQEDLDNVIFSDDKMYLVLSKNKFLAEGHNDYLCEIDFENEDYKNIEKLPLDAYILSSYEGEIYLYSIDEQLGVLSSYNVANGDFTDVKKSLILTTTYKMYEDYLFKMEPQNTGIIREDLNTGELLEVTLEAKVLRSSLIGVYDNRVMFGYERLDEYRYFHMNLDNMNLNEIFLFYSDEENIPPKIIAELSEDFIVKIEDENKNEQIAIIKKSDFWVNKDAFLIFN